MEGAALLTTAAAAAAACPFAEGWSPYRGGARERGPGRGSGRRPEALDGDGVRHLEIPRLGARRNRRNQQPTELASPRRSAKKPTSRHRAAPTISALQRPSSGEPMDRFQDGHHVWLRSRVHSTYLNANSDGKTVSLRGRRASLKAAWTVHIYHGEGDAEYLLLHSAAYGRYLAAAATRAPLVHNGFRAEQRDYDEPEDQAIMWQAVGAGLGSNVMLRNVGGRYLRANGRYLRWNTGVSVEDMDDVSTMAHWIVEPIPNREAGMPDLPGPPNRVLYMVLGQAWRLIVFVRATAEGFYGEDGWFMFPFRGRSVYRLRNELADGVAFIDGQPPDGIAMCVRAGRYGRLTPLVVDLTRYAGHAETLQIVVMLSGTPAYDDLRYPDVDAV